MEEGRVMATPASVDSYIADLPPDRRPPMQALRSTIVAAAPRAIETIAYQMPALRLDGRFLVSYAAFKAHYSVFPASDMVVAGLGDELAPFLAGKGTIHFPASQPIPLDLVSRVVAILVAEHTTSGTAERHADAS